jgi:hypothetical protein
MTSIGIEKPPWYGYVDSNLVTADYPGSAKYRRECNRNANLQAMQGGHLYHYFADKEVAAGEDVRGNIRAYGSPYYYQLLPAALLRKKPELTLARMRVRAVVQDDETFYMQVATVANGYQPNAVDGANILEMQGDNTNGEQVFTLDNILVSPGPYETLGFFLRGGMTQNNYSGTGPQTGTAQAATDQTLSAVRTGQFTAAGAPTWESNIEDQGVYVEFSNQGGQFVITGKDNNDDLHFWPLENFQVNNATYELKLLATIQIISIAVYLKDREV